MSLCVTVAAVSSAVAATDTGTTGRQDMTMYDLSVRGASSDGAALAQRLDSLGFDVVARQGAVVHVLGGAPTVRQLAALGISVVARKPAAPVGPVALAPQNQNDILPRKLDGNTYPTVYGGYRTIAGYQQFESDVAAAYPKLAQKFTYGMSYTGDNVLTAMCITANANKGCKLKPEVEKARFLLMSRIHAREIATSETTWRFITRLLDGWKKDAQITSLLQGTEIWVVPQINPDGIAITDDGLEHDGTGFDSPAWQRKNWDRDQTPPGGCDADQWAFSQPGVDLNRNNDSHWGGAGTSPDPCDQEYPGTDPASESETTAINTLFKKLFRDQRGNGGTDPAPANTTGAMVTIHTAAGLVLLPWGYDSQVQTPNDPQLRSMAYRQSYFNHYTTGQPGEVLYNASGTSDDWSYDKLGIASFTYELDQTGQCEGFLPPYSCMNTYEANDLPSLYYAAAAARTPYKLSLGPTILDIGAKASGGTVKVTATADDDAFGTGPVGRPSGQKVKAGRIYVGTAPWDGGTSQSMTVQGNGTSVTLLANVAPGSKKVLAYVQGKDADGNWGPAMAVWIPAS
jgi:carboxypeptidase T